MKYFIKFSVLPLLIFFTGCSVTETIYLQDIKVTGPLNHPPLHITDRQPGSKFTISPRIAYSSMDNFSGNVEGHTPVNGQGVFQVDKITHDDGSIEYKESSGNIYKFTGENLTWDISNALFGVDADIALTEHFAIFGGFNYLLENKQELFGGSAGLGFFKQKENFGIRFDVGILWQEMSYNAQTVVVTTITQWGGSSNSYLNFYSNKDKSSSINFFGSFTYNTAFQNFPLNFFINTSFFGQSLFDFQPAQPDEKYYFAGVGKPAIDKEAEATAGFFSISPGISQNIGDIGRIIFGVRLVTETQLENFSDSFSAIPLLQIDFAF